MLEGDWFLSGTTRMFTSHQCQDYLATSRIQVLAHPPPPPIHQPHICGLLPAQEVKEELEGFPAVPGEPQEQLGGGYQGYWRG
jgi:hypothetical protein